MAPPPFPGAQNAPLLAATVCLSLRRYPAATTLGLLATALGLALWIDRRHQPGTPMVGAYLWLASMLVMAIGSEWARRSRNRTLLARRPPLRAAA